MTMQNFLRKPEQLSSTTNNKETTQMDRFDKAFQYLLPNEGGLTDNPKDPGGITKYGIILADLPKGSTKDDIRNLTVIRAEEIYRAKYWAPIHGDAYDSDAKATAIFDTAVSKGIGGCKSIINRVFNTHFQGEAWEYKDDLMNQIKGWSDKAFLQAMCEGVKHHIDVRIAANSDLETFRAGWTNRANRLLTLVAQ